MASLSRVAIVAAAVAILSHSCNAQVMSPERVSASQMSGQQMEQGADSSLRAVVSQQMNLVSACGSNERPLLVDPADIEVWLSSPVTRSNSWLSSLPSGLHAELLRVAPQLDSVAVLCVREEQADGVEATIDLMAQQHLADLQAAGVDVDALLVEEDAATGFGVNTIAPADGDDIDSEGGFEIAQRGRGGRGFGGGGRVAGGRGFYGGGRGGRYGAVRGGAYARGGVARGPRGGVVAGVRGGVYGGARGGRYARGGYGGRYGRGGYGGRYGRRYGGYGGYGRRYGGYGRRYRRRYPYAYPAPYPVYVGGGGDDGDVDIDVDNTVVVNGDEGGEIID